MSQREKPLSNVSSQHEVVKQRWLPVNSRVVVQLSDWITESAAPLELNEIVRSLFWFVVLTSLSRSCLPCSC